VSKEVPIANNVTPPPEESAPPAGQGTRARVFEVWADVLERTDIKPTDNFFDLGGDSLRALEVISRLQASLHVELPLRGNAGAPRS
jgi:aryl carrier-like protein